MQLPDYLADEATARLHADHSPAKLRRLLALLDLDLAEPGPDPDFDDLARKAGIEVSENESHGSLTFRAELSLLGYRVPVHLRYSYAGEFGFYPGDFDGFGMLGSVGQLDALVWLNDGRTPEWTHVNVGMLSRPMIEAIDDLVLLQVLKNRQLNQG